MFSDLMNTGDRVLTIANDFLAIERYDGSVELYPVLKMDNTVPSVSGTHNNSSMLVNLIFCPAIPAISDYLLN